MNSAPHRISRRHFLGTIGSAAALAGLGGCAGGTSSRQGPFRFLVVNDLHHASADCDPFFARLIEQMREHAGVSFCLVVGDLADKGRPESLRAIRDAFARLEIPVHCVPGNHDCDVEENTALYAGVFPNQLNYHFNAGGWQFIGLDSTDGNKWGGGLIQPATLAWLDDNLPTLDRERPTVLFTHFPLVPEVNPRLTPLNASDLVAKFDGWNLRCAFGGHYHARTERPHGAATLLTNCCCSRVRDNHDRSIPEGYLLCTAHPDGTLERELVRFTPAEMSLAANPV